MSQWYRLEGKIPVPIELCELIKMGGMESANRIIKQETIGELWVSTVFLMLDHSFSDGPPDLFETMIFTAARDERGRPQASVDYQERYSTWELALEGHERAVKWARENQPGIH